MEVKSLIPITPRGEVIVVVVVVVVHVMSGYIETSNHWIFPLSKCVFISVQKFMKTDSLIQCSNAFVQANAPRVRETRCHRLYGDIFADSIGR